MKIAIAGSSGLIGEALVKVFEKDHEVFKIVRSQKEIKEKTLFFDYKKIAVSDDLKFIDLASFENIDLLINLAGENIGNGRWNDQKKKEIFESRVTFSKKLCYLLTKLKNPPKVWMNGSAIGYYGDRQNEVLKEDSSPGSNFLATVCQDWEKAALEYPLLKTRLIFLRTGAILSEKGGMLAKMVPAFKWGFGGKLGKGDQFLSFITLHDFIRIILFLVENKEISGSINCATPYPITNEEFTKSLGAFLNRPTVFTLNASVLRFMFGQMADELLLAGQKVYPEKLLKAGFRFDFPTIDAAFNAILKLPQK